MGLNEGAMFTVHQVDCASLLESPSNAFSRGCEPLADTRPLPACSHRVKQSILFEAFLTINSFPK